MNYRNYATGLPRFHFESEPVPPAPPPTGAAPPEGSPPPAPAGGDSSTVPPAGDSAKPAGTELGKPGEKPPAPAAAVVFDAAKLTLPEGMKVEDPTFKEFSTVFNDAVLDPQARGQKLIDLHVKTIQDIRQAQVDAWTSTNAGWIKDVKADPDIGGAKFEPTKAAIAKAIDGLGPELSVAFRQGLDATGAGNHPAIWKGLAKMAALLTEGGHVTGTPPSGRPDLATTFFPNSKMT